MIMNAVHNIIWAIQGAFVDAWGTVMTWLFLPGDRLGFWQLRRSTEAKGAPHMTRKLAAWIQGVAFGVEGVTLLYGIYKIWLLYGGAK